MKKQSLFTVLVLLFVNTHGQIDFKSRFQSLKKEEKTQFKIPFNDHLGNEGTLPVALFKGTAEGPVFTFLAGVHGCEYAPIIAVQNLIQRIDLKKLKGTLIILPISSTGSFYTRTPYKNGQDNTNLNGAFPGNKEGTITQKVAHYITTNIIPVSDVFLDIHSGDAPEDLLPFICFYNNQRQKENTAMAKRLSEISGFQYVVSYPYTITDDEPAKYAFKQAVQDGKIALSIESGRLGIVEEETVELIEKGVLNMLHEMEMYEQQTPPHPNRIYLNHQLYIRAQEKGIFYSKLKAGDQVNKGEKVGYTTDEFGTVIEEHFAPQTGIILYTLSTPPINAGDTVMCVSSLKE